MDWNLLSSILGSAGSVAQAQRGGKRASAGEQAGQRLLWGVGGVLLLIAGVMTSCSHSHIARRGVTVPGHVLETKVVPEGKRSGEVQLVYIRITVPGHGEIKRNRSFATTWRLPADRQVMVTYLPDDPTEWEVEGEIRERLPPSLLLLFGVALLAIGWRSFFVTVWRGWRASGRVAA